MKFTVDNHGEYRVQGGLLRAVVVAFALLVIAGLGCWAVAFFESITKGHWLLAALLFPTISFSSNRPPSRFTTWRTKHKLLLTPVMILVRTAVAVAIGSELLIVLVGIVPMGLFVFGLALRTIVLARADKPGSGVTKIVPPPTAAPAPPSNLFATADPEQALAPQPKPRLREPDAPGKSMRDTLFSPRV